MTLGRQSTPASRQDEQRSGLGMSVPRTVMREASSLREEDDDGFLGMVISKYGGPGGLRGGTHLYLPGGKNGRRMNVGTTARKRGAMPGRLGFWTTST
jgi:hypothetical protein